MQGEKFCGIWSSMPDPDMRKISIFDAAFAMEVKCLFWCDFSFSNRLNFFPSKNKQRYWIFSTISDLRREGKRFQNIRSLMWAVDKVKISVCTTFCFISLGRSKVVEKIQFLLFSTENTHFDFHNKAKILHQN